MPRVNTTTCSLTDEKRQRYRTTLESDLLSVAAIDLEGRKTPGYVFDVSASGLGLFFDRRTDPGYEAGTVLWLCINSPYLRERVVAPAQIRRVTSSQLGRLYGFRLIEWKGLVSRIPADAASLFNRRSCERVKLEQQPPIEIVAEGSVEPTWRDVDERWKGDLMEVSANGLSFKVAETGKLIEPRRSVEVSFSLPKSEYEFSMWTEVVRCASGPDGVRCGARFDPRRTELFQEKQERLIALLASSALSLRLKP